jgi:hypothetical protein
MKRTDRETAPSPAAPARLPAALRAAASGIHPLEAGTSLLIDCGCWLHREDFTGQFVTTATSISDGTTLPCWPPSTGKPPSPPSTPASCHAAAGNAASSASPPASPAESQSTSTTTYPASTSATPAS